MFVHGLILLINISFLTSLIWFGEEPAKTSSIFAILTVTLLAAFFIHYAWRHHIITNSNIWLTVFGIRLLIATLIILAFWYSPDLSHRNPDYGFDPARWDAWGAGLAQGDVPWLSSLYPPNSYGMIYYIGGIYRIFGVSCIYITWFNAVIALATLLLISYLLTSLYGIEKRWDWVCLGLLIPDSLWFESLALREVHTAFFLVITICGVYDILSKGKFIRGFLMFCIGYLGFLAFRAKLAIFPLIFILFYYFITKGNLQRKTKYIYLIFLLLLLPLAIFIEPLIEEFFGNYSYILSGDYGRLLLKGGTGGHTFEAQSINTLFVPSNIYERVLFLVPRTILNMFSPFPKINLLWAGWFDPDIVTWHAAYWTCNTLSMIIMISFLPPLLASFYNAIVLKGSSNLIWFVFPYIIFLIAISNGELAIGERWRTASFPFWVAIVILGMPYKQRFKSSQYIIIVSGILVYVLLKLYLS